MPGLQLLTDRRLRIAFWLYAALLFTMTHWPNLKVPGPQRSDLLAHLTAFSIWTVLFGLAAFYGPRFSRRNIALTALTAAIYAGIDEALQFPEFLRRTVSWADYAANLTGVATGTLVLFIIGWWVRRRETTPNVQP